MMEIEAGEFWGGETNHFHPYETYPEYGQWSSRETITASGCRQITSPQNSYLPNFTGLLEETHL